ncbi:TetR/AcrR family transcriptional regulator [Oceanitalea stevensii]|uniref:TetR family transcriptional regulator n=1 Tax=Oceanitalea stevensii TaxID=2763072 RepID=A0ABR8YYC8_9MICO|nr:TetR/AcrR family transcriptional regulator [Oceanitalea stevensii]MBD8061050.1 TetR family transcriptional regulator [Oceanitalea stevensii]
MSIDPPGSLRERRKAETWLAIHDAAATLALERGLENATVEATAEAAGISPRTFFNYFATKDDAVLGVRTPTLDRALLDGFSLDGDLLGQVTRLLLEVFRSALDGPDRVRRHELLAKYPHLARRRKELTVEAEDLVRQALTDLLAQDPSWTAGIDGHSVDEVARMLVMLAGVPLRSIVTSPDRDAGARIRPEDVDASLSLLHELTRKIS